MFVRTFTDTHYSPRINPSAQCCHMKCAWYWIASYIDSITDKLGNRLNIHYICNNCICYQHSAEALAGLGRRRADRNGVNVWVCVPQQWNTIPHIQWVAAPVCWLKYRKSWIKFHSQLRNTTHHQMVPAVAMHTHADAFTVCTHASTHTTLSMSEHTTKL